MIRELIACLFLLLVGCVLFLSGREISLKNKGSYLTTTASLKKHANLDLKLSLNSNRLRVRRKTGFLPSLSGSSYSLGSMAAHLEKFCPNPSFNERAYVNSLTFSNGIGIEDLQLIFTDDSSVSNWWDWNGVLGLNPFEGCKNENDSLLDPLAPLNQLRGNYSGFILDTDKLIFANGTFQSFELPLDGMFFEMEQISIGDLNFSGVAMKGKLDLESKYIKVPAQYFDEIEKKLKPLVRSDDPSTGRSGSDEIKKVSLGLPISIELPSQEKSLKFPLERYLWGYLCLRGSGLSDYRIKSEFKKHDEPYWSFGLMFLEDFRVYWDLKRKKIGFEPRNSS